MKLVTYRYEGKEQVGVVTADGGHYAGIESLGLRYRTMTELIRYASPEELDLLRKRSLCDGEGAVPISRTVAESPIPEPAQDVICIGKNYLDHIKEGARFRHTEFDSTDIPTIYFSKRVNRAVPDGGFILSHDDLTAQLDYESELAVILSRDAFRVSREEAGKYIFGYTILNDVSARDVQARHKQYYLGKSMEGFTPMGPWIVTADEFPQNPVFEVMSRVNGELRQHNSTDHMIYSIAYMIEELSSCMLLKAGTIISTGTPEGVGLGFQPPRFLTKGDVVECIIPGIGSLTNTVK